MRRLLTLVVFLASAFAISACGGAPGSNSGSAYYPHIIVDASAGTPAPHYDVGPQLAAAEEYRWKHPGGDPNKETVAQSVERFADKVPADVRGLLVWEYKNHAAISGIPGYEGAVWAGEIFPGMHTTRMTFGYGKVVPNVIVDPRDFQAPQWQRASKRVAVYQITKKSPARNDTYYIYVFEVCGNVALVILDTQGNCITDETLCRDCGEVHAVERVR